MCSRGIRRAIARRYARWYESHPREAQPPMESTPVEVGRGRGVRIIRPHEAATQAK